MSTSPSRRKFENTVRGRKTINGQLQCIVTGCRKNRHDMWRFCKAHAHRKLLYGHPQGAALPRTLIFKGAGREYGRCYEIIQMNDGNSYAVKLALEKIKKEAYESYSTGHQDFRYHFAQYHTHHPHTMLAIIAAVYILQEEQPRSFHFLSDEHFRVSLGHAVGRGVRRAYPNKKVMPYRYRNGYVIRDLAKYVVGQYGLLGLQIAKAAKRKSDKAEEYHEACREPDLKIEC